MAPRAVGALIALVAALAFAIALAGGVMPKTVPGWWDGHPIVNGKVIERKAIHVGLLEADGCNITSSGTDCKVLETGHTLDVVGFAEIGALVLGIVTGILAFVSIKRVGDRRKFLSKLLLFEVVLIGGGAGAIFFHGPDLHVDVRLGMPVGLGLYATIAGCAFGFVAGVLGMRVTREPLRLKPSEPRIPVPHPQQHQPAFDVRELLPPPAAPMRVSHPHMVPPSPGGPLPGPSGPLMPMGAPNPNPLFESAPQLRPLYDMHNAGAAPNPMAPVLPARPPTPIPRDQVSARFGVQPPPPLEVPTPATHGLPPDVPAGDSAAFYPPVNAYPAARPMPQRPIDQTEDLERPSDPSFASPFAPPPQPAKRPPRPSAPPPPRKNPTIATAVPPMPAMDAPPVRSSELDLAMTVPLEKPSAPSFDAAGWQRGGVDEAAAAGRAGEWQRGDVGPAHAGMVDSSRFAEPVRPNATEENQLVVGDATSQNQVGEHTGENFDEALTREPAKYDPVAPPPAPAAMRLEDSPSQIGHAETELARLGAESFDGNTAATGDAFADPDSSPVIAPPAPPPTPPPPPMRAKPTAPPPVPTAGLRAQSEAPTTSADVDRVAKERAAKQRAHSEQPTAAARGTGPKAALDAATVGGMPNGSGSSPRVTSGTRTTSSVANEAATVAAPASANEALAAASTTAPEPPKPAWGAPDDASEPKRRNGPPKPWGAPATDPGERAAREPSGPKAATGQAPSGPPKPWGAANDPRGANDTVAGANRADAASTAMATGAGEADPGSPRGSSDIASVSAPIANEAFTRVPDGSMPRPRGANEAPDSPMPRPWGATEAPTRASDTASSSGPNEAPTRGSDPGSAMPRPWGATEVPTRASDTASSSMSQPTSTRGSDPGSAMPRPWGANEAPTRASDTASSSMPTRGSDPGSAMPRPWGATEAPSRVPETASISMPKPWGAVEEPRSGDGPTVPSTAPTPSSSPGEGPARIGVPNIPARAPLPAPRVGRPSVPPPATKLPAFAKPTLSPTSGPATAKTTEPPPVKSPTPSPFGTIPSPFRGGKSPTIPPAAVAPLPPLPAISIPKQPTATLTTPQELHEQPTEAPRSPRQHRRADSEVIEPPTYAVRSNSSSPIDSDHHPEVGGEIERRSDRSLDPSTTKSGDAASLDELASRPSGEIAEPPTYHAPEMPQAKYGVRDSEAPTRAVGGGNQSNLDLVKPRAISTAAPDLAPPAEQVESNGPSPACPQCEAPMAWVEQHLRFYCASCRMYF